ncbi:FAD dependent oxidoreductase [Gracilibacillus ureilyticus]|uniref:FAD dependent oxidoreductase n=1 Tax=Gracilibacillus ureilyticus TaxID=531814 RepID=A0A1H9RD84_9BACI|nr:FAD-dependent oxidoreductase [Gracilibacillus ureilyticus]SER70658.1 FAD dependent oxidoreductase [Gracilibacillus ureilyticus]
MKKVYIWGLLILVIIVIGGGITLMMSNNNKTNTVNEDTDAAGTDTSTEDMETLVKEYQLPKAMESFDESYDVIVIGGEPEGVAAAVSAARNGQKTLLVETREELGGLFTYGMLNFLDIPQGVDGKNVSEGIFKEWHQMVGNGNAFRIEEAKAAFKKLVDNEDNLSLTTKTDVMEAVKDDTNTVTSVKLSNEHGEFEVAGEAFIDATQDADFAVMADAPYFTGGEDIGIADRRMAVTLMIHLTGVDWDGVRRAVEEETFGTSAMNDHVAWGFSDLHYDYKPVQENTRLRGLNLAKVGDEYFINALQIFGINGLDEESKQHAIEVGATETEHIVEFLRAEFPGFENAEIASIPEELYVRETRHILAEYQLPMADVWTNKDHWDSIALGAYPVDVQAQTTEDYGFVIADPIQYAIPFRSIVPQEVNGLLVVSRSAGYSSLAAGSARIVPTGMAVAEGAGAAAAVANEEGISFREMTENEELIEQVRTKLDEQGAYVDHFELEYPYQGEWYDESIQKLINYGVVVASYTNELPVDDQASNQALVNVLNSAIQRSNGSFYEMNNAAIQEVYSTAYAGEPQNLTKEMVLENLSAIFAKDASSANWDALIEQGVVTAEHVEQLPDENVQYKHIYALVADMVTYLENLEE